MMTFWLEQLRPERYEKFKVPIWGILGSTPSIEKCLLFKVHYTDLLDLINKLADLHQPLNWRETKLPF